MTVVARPSLVLLHGSNGSGVIMRPIVDAVRDEVDVHALDMIGHGGRPVPERFTVEDLASDVIAQMDAANIAQAFVFGYSSGGTIAIYLALHNPQRFLGVSALAAKYVFDRRTVAHWTHLTDPARLGRPGNKRAEQLSATHAPQNWVDVTNGNRRMFEDWGRKPPLSEDELCSLTVPALLFSSDQDQLVPVEETVALGKLIPNSRVVIFRGQSHPLQIVPIAALGRALCNWIAEVQAGRAATTGAP